MFDILPCALVLTENSLVLAEHGMLEVKTHAPYGL